MENGCRMDAQSKRMWLEALQSGEYEKGAVYLCHDNKHCALGVLCDVMGLDYHEEYISYDGPDRPNSAKRHDKVTVRVYRDSVSDIHWHNTIPWQLEEKIKLPDDAESTIALLNDESDSFEPVIKYIEEYL